MVFNTVKNMIGIQVNCEGMRLTVFIFLLFFSAAGFADIAKKKDELAEVQSQIKHIGLKIKQIRSKKDSLITQLAALETQVGEISRSLKKLRLQADQKKLSLKRIKIKIVKLQKNIDEQNEALAGQVRAAYTMGRHEKIKLMLNQQDPALSSRIMIYYDYLNQARLAKLKIIRENLLDLHMFEQKEVQEAEDLQLVLEQKQAEQAKLVELTKARKQLLVKLDKDFKKNKGQLSLFKENEIKLQGLITALQKVVDDKFVAVPDQPFAKLRGQLPWPIKGQLRKKFGSKRGESRWDGVVIDANEGIEIHAVSSGRIVYADWLRGYGLLAIIDHGNGYMSLYAFNQSLFKDVGDWVDAGEVIASVGKSGGRNEPGLYFGIRKKGKPVNPVKWCRKVRKGRVG
jgi:murein hydrolase activator